VSDDYEQTMQRLSEGYERQLAAVLDAIDDGLEPLNDWRGVLHDVAGEIDRIVRRNVHPDDVASARSAMSLLTGVWFAEEEVERIYLGGGQA
jgi:hypothetical protein